MNIDEKQSTHQLLQKKSPAPRNSLNHKGSFSKLLDTSITTDHEIKRGDTLWNIVKTRLAKEKAHTTNHAIADGVKRVASWNVIQNPDLIFTGNRLDVSPLLPAAQYAEHMQQEIHSDKAAESTKSGEQSKPSINAMNDASAGHGLTAESKPPFDSSAENQTNSSALITPKRTSLSEQMAKYKIDQLLAAPGGKKYEHHDDAVIIHEENAFAGFADRVNKDFDDAKENIRELGRDLTSGSLTHYIAADGAIKTRQKTGLLKTAGKFIKDLTSGLSFGAYIPEGEERVAGSGRIKHFFYKVFNEALVQDAGRGVSSSIVSGAQHALLAAWNTLEAVPDATIGNLQAGRKLTDTVFDNGQVAVSYITDIVPGGEAWFRVHSPGSSADGWSVPLYYNLKTAEQGIDDPRWETVRNTPFRKTIETIGALLADTPVVRFIGKGPINTPPDFSGKKD
ncbi:MAG: LysM domain-containing protein [Pseudomonadota bacterium]